MKKPFTASWSYIEPVQMSGIVFGESLEDVKAQLTKGFGHFNHFTLLNCEEVPEEVLKEEQMQLDLLESLDTTKLN